MRPAKRAGAAALTLGLLALTAAATRADDVTLIETGSSLIYPLFKVWAAEYEKTHPGVHIATSSTGSTEGVKQAILGVAHIGTSDAYMTDAEANAGRIRAWDDKAIAFINPDINLPHHDIIAVHRADGSGDTFVFTQYLTFSTTPRRRERDVGFGNSVNWPDVSGALSATGNTGVLQTMQQNPYSIGYLGISYHTEVCQS